jgi:hypothetical protein
MSDQSIPYYLRPADRRTSITGLRVYIDQKQKLTDEFKGSASLLVRLLLDAYFKDTLPDVKAEFEKQITVQP